MQLLINMEFSHPSKSRSIASLIDIVILGAAVFAFEALSNRAIPFPSDVRAQIVVQALSKLPLLLAIWLLLRMRHETPAAIGLKTPSSWPRTLSLGVIVGLGIFVAVFLLERAGLHRDLSAFSFLRGNLELTIYQSIYVIIAAGFYEEVLFRGFLLQRLALLFGGERIAWITACVIQAIVFGYAHAYQNPQGMLLTGTVGLVFGFVFLRSGRNIWPAIVAHAVYDVARTIMFYFTGPP
ncbi:MAG: protease family protein [Verrucomicrobiota bacterium]